MYPPRPTLAAVFVVACCGLAAGQADKGRTESLARRAADRLQSLHDEADRLATEERTLLGDLRRLELERQIKSEELRRLDVEIATVTGQLDSLDAQTARLRAEDLAEEPALRARILNLYKLGSARYLRLLLSTSDVGQIGRASRVVAALADRDRVRAAAHQRRLQELAASRTAIAERRQQLKQLRADAERAKVLTDRAVEARNGLIRDIDQRRDLNAQLASELLTSHQKLQGAIASLGAGGPADPPTLPLRPFKGELEWPTTGTIRQRFGRPQASGAVATGIDIAAAEGTLVEAIHDGAVAFAETFAGFGKLIILDHGNQTFSLYGNLNEVGVARGAHIERGQPIGTVGVSPTGAAGLYFELRVDGRPVDPLQWLRKR